ncbi:MAG: NUDIX hydrolase [Sulfobacillus acidophilus]|uniref:NUDIX hydrolase n=1 Tax=Sulfobacillus acidophilus TaxID=53633 RepID=A0A2T2WHR7_9FIRM|nr:MAG: NUDIX hydrolase [Sulfobacillus acidophilus]
MKPPSAKGRYITCADLSGRVGTYAADTIRFRPAAYGILEHHQNILLSRSRFTGLWDFPGGGVEPFESLPEGMTREFYEETGLTIVAGPLVYVAEGFIAMFGHPFHSLRFYYRCVMHDVTAVTLDPDMNEVSVLQWWPRDELPIEQMHASDQEAYRRFMHE